MDAPVNRTNSVMPQPEIQEIDLSQYIAILRRRKFGIFSLAFLFAVLAALVAMSMTPVYKSTSTLLIEADDANVVSIEEVYGIEKASKEYYQTQFEILKSRQLAEKVIDQRGLASHPEFLEVKDTGILSLLAGWWSELPDWRSYLPEGLFPGMAKVADEQPGDVRRAELIDEFQSRLSVTPVRNSQLVKISFEANDRKLAATLANAIANTYIENEMESRLQMTATAMGWLTGRLQGLRDKLEQSERELQEFREREQLVEVGGVKTLSAEQLSELNQKLVLTRQKHAEAYASYKQAKSIKSLDDPEVSTIPAVLQDKVVGDLKSVEAAARRTVSALEKRYGPKHPKMIAANADLAEAEMRVKRRMREVLSGMEKQYRVVSAEMSSLQSAMGETKGELQQINRKGYELGVLEREVETNRQLYELFLGRLKETSETSGMQTANARIVDPAAPEIEPAKPKKKLIVLVAAFAGLFLGIVWAFLLEHLDRTLKGSGDMEDKLDLPVLGILPHVNLKPKSGENPLQHIRDNPQGLFSESLRTVRTGVLLSGLDNPHKVIMVTSSVPGEGKTTVSATVAETLAEMHKVLLIDADMRRPTVRNLFDIDKSHPGLSDFVSGSAEISKCMVKVGDKNLYVLPAGAIPPNPLELLSSKRFSDALAKLSETFDQIIIDSAPSLAVSDALVLSTLASGVIYVVRADLTPYPMAQEGLKRLRRANAHLIGGVLNQVPLGKKAGYGNYGRYGYYGDQYYGSYGYTSG
jgi:capsular exopolysaccharide synthesis family protein